ncbi:hypothetical protein ACWGJY_36065, partial [Streptomyces sp. NPDC054765]
SCLRVTPSFLPGSVPMRGRNPKVDHNHTQALEPKQHLGPYLLVKALFFLALMKPTDPARTDKQLKWRFRRHLLTEVLEQYERTGAVDPARFPTLGGFAARRDTAGHP